MICFQCAFNSTPVSALHCIQACTESESVLNELQCVAAGASTVLKSAR